MRKAILFVVFILLTSVLAVRGEVQQISTDSDPAAVIRVIGNGSDAKMFSYKAGLEVFTKKMSNEDAAFYDNSYKEVMEVATNIKIGLPENSQNIADAKKYSENLLEKIGTPLLRRKFASRMMSDVDDRIFLGMGQSYEGRQLSVRTKVRLLSLLEFLAERHTGFLGVLNSASKS